MSIRKKRGVLIIDDERYNISALKIILSPEYTVYASINGKDAIETAEEFMPDIILLDVLMPDMDGYDVITILKASEKTRDIPVIFITGLDNIEAEIKGLALGAADYILKPFHPAIVKLRVQNQLQLVERLKQQTLMTKIAHNYLANANSDALHTDTLRMLGEFMGIMTILLYKFDIKNNVLVCQNEWINPGLNLQTCIGDIVELNDDLISITGNLLSGDEKDLCFYSRDPLRKNLIKIKKQYFEDYITTPVFIKGKICGILVFSREEEHKWNESEIDLIVLAASVFSGVFERDAIQNMEYLSRAKSEFLSNMSHEMRTPMNAIMGMLQVLDIYGVPDNIKEHCNVMNTAAHSLMHLIDDVLDVSDMEYGEFKLFDSVFNFNTMIKNILREADANARKKRHFLDSKIDPSIPPLLSGDEKRLKQVVNILLSNAIKFTPENGEIYFDARKINEDNGIITLQIEVADNGIGISQEQQSKLFTIFEQADTGNTREYAGIGIGLTLSKRVVEMMDGNIWVESELRKGSKFYFTCKLKKG